jgi:hypothetical protein
VHHGSDFCLVDLFVRLCHANRTKIFERLRGAVGQVVVFPRRKHSHFIDDHLRPRFDGEAVSCGDNGIASFDRIRYRRHEADVFMWAFDLIELNGDDLRRAAGRGAGHGDVAST